MSAQQANPQQPASAPRLTVAMIVRDAQASLEASLESVAQVADELVVVDTGSTDGTLEVAKRYGARILNETWQDDFSAARNAALAAAQGNWVLWLDAGERLSSDSHEALRAHVTAQPDPSTAYLVMVEVPPETPDAAAQQAARVRLMPGSSPLRFGRRVCEQLVGPDGPPTLAMVSVRLLRSQDEHDPQLKQSRARRNLRLLNQELETHGRQAWILVGLGDACERLGETEPAIEYYREATRTAAPGSTDQLEGYYGLLSTMDGLPQRAEERMAIGLEALERFPTDAQLLCAMGGYLQAQGNHQLARRSWSVALKIGQVDPLTWHVCHIRELAALCLAALLQQLGEHDEAVTVVQEAIGRCGASERLVRLLVELQIARGDTVAAMAQVEHLGLEGDARAAVRSAVRGAVQAAQQNWIAALGYLQTAYEAGCRDTICLRWLSLSLISTGRLQTARGVLMAWKQAEPHNSEVARYLDALDAAPATAGASGAAPTGPSAPDRPLRVDSATAPNPQATKRSTAGRMAPQDAGTADSDAP